MAQAQHEVPAYESVALVDLSYLFRKAWHAQAEDAEVNAAPRLVLDELARVRDSVDHVIICVDSPPYWRKQLFPEYKATREPPSDGMKAAMRWLRERVEADGYQVAGAESYEADDVIATLAAEYAALGIKDIRLVGCDKDLAQCVVGGTRQYVPAVGTRPEVILDMAGVEEKFGVKPRQIPEYLALVGDTSDNIPGVDGIGPKRAAQILKAYGSLAEMYADLESDSEEPLKVPFGEKTIAALRVAKAKVFGAVGLTELRTDAPVDARALLEPKAVRRLTEVPEPADDEDEPPQRAPSAPPPKQTEAIVLPPVAPAPSWDLALQPSSAAQAHKFATALFNSRLYAKFGNPDAIFAVILRGREIGVGMTTALDGFHVIEGKPSPSADLIRSLAEKDPACEYFMLVSSDDTHAEWETKHRRHPRPTTYRYTIEDAKKAGLSSGNWAKRPRDMLVKTAGSKLARIVYPSATCGLYCPEEMGE